MPYGKRIQKSDPLAILCLWVQSWNAIWWANRISRYVRHMECLAQWRHAIWRADMKIWSALHMACVGSSQKFHIASRYNFSIRSPYDMFGLIQTCHMARGSKNQCARRMPCAGSFSNMPNGKQIRCLDPLTIWHVLTKPKMLHGKRITCPHSFAIWHVWINPDMLYGDEQIWKIKSACLWQFRLDPDMPYGKRIQNSDALHMACASRHAIWQADPTSRSACHMAYAL